MPANLPANAPRTQPHRALFSRSSAALPYLALISGVLALSLSGLFVHWADAPGVITSLYRMIVAALALTPFALRRALPGRKALTLGILGGLALALDLAFWSTAIHYTQIGTATLINYIAPLWVALYSALFLRVVLARRFWLGLAITFTGIVSLFAADLRLHAAISLGDLLALISSIFYAAYYIVTQRARQNSPSVTYLWIVSISGAFFLLIASLLLRLPLTGYPPTTYLVFIGAGLVSQVIGLFSLVFALGHLPAFVVAPSMIAEPVLTTLLAIPFAGQLLHPWQWIGGAAVLGGIYLINRTQPTAGEPAIPHANGSVN